MRESNYIHNVHIVNVGEILLKTHMSKYDSRSLGEEKHPYAFQQKIVMRYIRRLYSGKERVAALTTYCTICWIASDFSNDLSEKEVNNWPKTIATYSGIGRGTAQRYIREFVERGIITYERQRSSQGRWQKRKVILPAHLPECITAPGQTTDGETTHGLAVDGQENIL